MKSSCACCVCTDTNKWVSRRSPWDEGDIGWASRGLEVGERGHAHELVQHFLTFGFASFFERLGEIE